MADGKRLDPFRGFNFTVVVAGFPSTLAFQKISGLNIGVEKTEYREGADNNTVRKLPGLAVFDDIVMERGVSDSVHVVNWMKEIVDLNNEDALPGDDEFRREVTIQVRNRNKQIVRTYVVTAAWPSKLELADLDGSSSDVLIETLTLCHEGVKVDTAVSDIALQS